MFHDEYSIFQSKNILLPSILFVFTDVWLTFATSYHNPRLILFKSQKCTKTCISIYTVTDVSFS